MPSGRARSYALASGGSYGAGSTNSSHCSHMPDEWTGASSVSCFQLQAAQAAAMTIAHRIRFAHVTAPPPPLLELHLEPTRLVAEPADARDLVRARTALHDRLDDTRDQPALEVAQRPPDGLQPGAGDALVHVDTDLGVRDDRH